MNSNKKRRFDALQELPLSWDIWVNNILPYVGIGHFAFVAPVNHQMKNMYLLYCTKEKNPPEVLDLDLLIGISGQEPSTRHAIGTDTFYQSAAFFNVACAEYWDSQNNEQANYNISALDQIAQTGNLEVFKWAQEKKFPWDNWTCAEAAQYGHLTILKYAHENGCPWHELTCCRAAAHGHLECLKYAYENGCPWDEDTCKEAAANGQLECLKYAHENGCLWEERM